MNHTINIKPDAIYKGVRVAVKASIKKVMVEHSEGVKQSISTSGDTGPSSSDPRAYWYPKNWRRYVLGSAPNTPPNKQRGELLEGISTQDIDQGPIVGTAVHSAAPHSLWLEKGTRNMIQRPFLRPKFMETTRKVIANLKRRVLFNRVRGV